MIYRFFKWLSLAVVVGILVGGASSLFLMTLDRAIAIRKMNPWLISLLPFVGAIVAFFFKKFGKDVDGGNNLILDEIHEPKRIIKLKLLPMIFISSVLSHLFGASVGREGVAVQMGSVISDQVAKFLGPFKRDRAVVLMVGMSAGFASIFGTPFAGTIFGLEVLSLWPLSSRAFFPCLVASYVGHYTAAYLGATHAHYAPIVTAGFSLAGTCYVLMAAVCFGLCARFFNWSLHYCKDVLKEKIPNVIVHPLIGGGLLALGFYFIGTDRYLNIGQEIITDSFQHHVYPWDFAGKLFATVLSVASGFRGGEVMSLFYMGATLGNALSFIFPLSLSLLSALGFVSVFSGVANTPVAALALALSIFNRAPEFCFYAAIAVMVSYLVSGHNGIYRSRRSHRFKKF